MKIVKKFEKKGKIPTAGNVPPGTIFTLSLDDDKRIFLKVNDDLVMGLDDCKVVDIYDERNLYKLEESCTVHVLNATLTVE